MARDPTLSFRQPRLRVTVDGEVVRTALDTHVVSNNYYSADWFQVSFQAGQSGNYSIGYWSSVDRPLIEISVATDGSTAYSSLILGHGDRISVDYSRHIVKVSGRDLSALLVDSALHEAFPNHTGDAIVSLLALRHGLNPKVVPTPGLVGRMFAGTQQESGLSSYSRALTDWDLIVRLAQRSGYDAYVVGKDFHFEPPLPEDRPLFPLDPSATTNLRMERNLALNVPSDRMIATWNSQLQRSLLPVASAGNPVTLPPNLQPDTATRLLSVMIAETERQIRTLDISLPGETQLTARSRLALRGTNTEFDRDYDIECIERSFSPASGFNQRIRARQSISRAMIISGILG